ncbi:MAG: dihydroorotase [Oscillospiraceae bacterium]
MLNLLLKNATVYFDGGFRKADVLIKDGVVANIAKGISAENTPVIDVNNFYILPGFADVHVHLRQPGFLYKETIQTGTKAAAKGGFTLLASMPNLNPVPDSVENMLVQQEIIHTEALIKVIPYAAITKGEKGEELVDFSLLKDKCFAFSDDGKGVQKGEMMLKAMEGAHKAGKAIVAHCEDESLLNGGYIHQGEYAKLHGHRGISSQSEYAQVARDIELVRRTGVQYHVCHISTEQTVELVRKAKAEGLRVSCETAPHYLAFTDMDLQEDGRFKMNPPIRSEKDRAALIKGVQDGTIEVIATDHAPHSLEEKSKGLEKSNMGVVGIETSFAAIYTYMVKTGKISLEKLVELMSINPRAIFGLPYGIKIGKKADFTVVDTLYEEIVRPETFASKGRATPFEGLPLTGKVKMTVYDGEIVYQDKLL